LKRKILISLTVSILLLTSFLGIIQVSAAGESWPTLQYNIQRTSTAENTGPKTNNVVWSWYSGYATPEEMAVPYTVAFVPAISNGKVYVGTEDNRLVALDEFTGEFIWEFQTDDKVRVPPTVANGKVFFGSLDAYFYALDANDGTLVWKYGPVDSPWLDVGVWTIGSIVSDGLVVFGAEDVYALNEETGDLVWRKNIAGEEDLAIGVASDGNLVLVPSFQGGMHALDIDTGDQEWVFETGEVIESIPAIAYGNAYFGSTDNYTYAVDLNTGELVWKTEHGWSEFWDFGGGGWNHPAVTDNRVFIGPAADGNVLALDAFTGDIIWSYQAGNLTFGGPSVVDGVVYGGGFSGEIYAIDANDGSLIWEFETDGIALNGAPAIADGMLIWGSAGGYLYAIGEPVLPSEIPTDYFYVAAVAIAIIIIIVAVVVLRRRS
jgi:outer membrane protein assembly factor BamB